MGAKKIERSETTMGEAEEEPSNTHQIPRNQKPMERTKKRKALDKERRRTELESHDRCSKMDTPTKGEAELEGEGKEGARTKKRKALDKERRRAELESHDRGSKMDTPTKGEAELEGEGKEGVRTEASQSALPELQISLFRDLSSVDASVRKGAAVALMRDLQKVQEAYESSGVKPDVAGVKLEAEKDDGLENCAPSVRYAIRRLIRGVSSSREFARQGFALALTATVMSIHAIKVESVLKLVVNFLEISSSMKGQEAKDSLFGRLFAYGALARSGRISDDLASCGDTKCLQELIDQLLYLAGKKQYLREPSSAVILDLAKTLPPEAVSVQILGAKSMHEWFEKAIIDKNPDALFTALKLKDHVCSDADVFCGLLPRPFCSNSFFSVEHLSSLVPCFQETTFCQPRVHSIWPVLVDLLMSSVSSQEDHAANHSSKKHRKSRKGSSEDTLMNVKNFIDVVIEGSLLASSHDRKKMALEVVLLLLKLPASCIGIILSYKLVNCLMDILSTKGTWLYGAAQHFLKELVNWIGNDVYRKADVIVSLQKHSNGRFDCITRTHIVKDLVARFNSSSECIQFVQRLINLFIDGGGGIEELSDQSQTTDENSEKDSVEDSQILPGNGDSLKSWIIDILPRVLKNLKRGHGVKSLAFKDENVKFSEEKFHVQAEIMKFLAVQGLFSSSLGNEVTSFELQEKFRWPKVPASSSLRELCIQQLQFLMEDAQKDRSHIISHDLETNDLGSYFVCFLNTLCNFPSVSLFRTLSKEDEQSFKKLQDIEARFFQEERKIRHGSDANKLHALRYLLIQLLLQVLLHPGEFSEVASELAICCKNAFPQYFEADHMQEDDNSRNEDDITPNMIDVLIDTLLFLLPQSSGPMCYAVEQVFKVFCTEVTDNGLRSMLQVVKKDLKPLRHQVLDSVDEDDEGLDEDLLGIDDADDTGEVETADTADSDDQADKPRDKPDGESIAMDEDMDDEMMFRMDSYITQFLKKSKKSGNDTATSQLMVFKFRVLSLLEIYLQKNPGKPQVFIVYSYLIRAFVNYSSAEGFKQLCERIGVILHKKLFKMKEYPKGTEIELSSLESLMEKSFRSACRSKIKSVSSLAQNSSLWLLKIILSRNLSESELAGTISIFQLVLTDYFNNKKCRLKPDFIIEIFKRYPSFASLHFAFILEKCSSAKFQYRQVEALDFIDTLMRLCVSTNKGDSDEDRSRKSELLKSHLPQLCHLIQQLVTKLPTKQSRRARMRKFCARTLELISSFHLNKSFLKSLHSDAHSACETQLGDVFRALMNE